MSQSIHRVIPHPPSASAAPDHGVRPAVTTEREFAGFYQGTVSSLRRFVARLLGNPSDAPDIAHEAYLKTYEALRSREIQQPQAYLFITARRLALRFDIRRVQRMRPAAHDALEVVADSVDDGTEEVMRREEQAALDAAILALPPGCQRVLVLQLRHGLSHAEIAQRLDISPSTVAHQLARALRLLREKMQAGPTTGEEAPTQGKQVANGNSTP